MSERRRVKERQSRRRAARNAKGPPGDVPEPFEIVDQDDPNRNLDWPERVSGAFFGCLARQAANRAQHAAVRRSRDAAPVDAHNSRLPACRCSRGACQENALRRHPPGPFLADGGPACSRR